MLLLVSTSSTPSPSEATSAYPSMMEAGKGGNGSGAVTSMAKILPDEFNADKLVARRFILEFEGCGVTSSSMERLSPRERQFRCTRADPEHGTL